MPERFVCTLVQKRRYINTLPFLSFNSTDVANVAGRRGAVRPCLYGWLSCNQPGPAVNLTSDRPTRRP